MLLTDYHEHFAKYYDLFYGDRDIAGEVNVAMELLELAASSSEEPVRLLDFGCGTGSHAVAFAGHGVEVVGFDISEPMLAQACRKAAEVTPTPRFFCGPIAGLLEEFGSDSFSAMVSFFNVFNCMSSVKEMGRHLRILRAMLSEGGRALIGVWNGAANIADEPRPQVRQYHEGDTSAHEVIRILTPEFDRLRQVCKLNYHVVDIDREQQNCREFRSVHDIHFLTPVHYRHLFETHDFRVLKEFPTGRPDEPLTAEDWFVSYLLE